MTLKTLEQRIFNVEGFKVIVHDEGQDKRGDLKIGDNLYHYDKAAPEEWTVAHWRKSRFEKACDWLSVVVIDADGNEVGNNKTLLCVRETYK